MLGLLALIAAGCVVPESSRLVDRHQTELRSEVSVHLERRSVPAIEGVMPGIGAGEFILDTGAQHTILDQAFARSLGLPLIEYAQPIRVTRGGVAAGEITHHSDLVRLELGSAAVLHFEPPVASLGHVQDQLAGLVGQDVLRNWIVVFDGPAREVRFSPPELLQDVLHQFEGEGISLERYPLTWWNGVPTLRLVCGEGVEATMVVDTGASMTSLPTATIEALGLRRRGSTRRAHIGGIERSSVYRCGSLELGGWRVPTWVDEHPGAFGLLGYDVLRRFQVVFDGPGASLWVASKGQPRSWRD